MLASDGREGDIAAVASDLKLQYVTDVQLILLNNVVFVFLEWGLMGPSDGSPAVVPPA